MKKKLCVILCLVVCLGVFAACGGNSKDSKNLSGPEGVVSKLVDAINNADADAFIKCFPPEEQEEMKAYKEILKSTLEELKSEGKIKVKVNDVEYNDDKTEATVKCTFTRGDETDESSVKVVKIDGNWYFKSGMGF